MSSREEIEAYKRRILSESATAFGVAIRTQKKSVGLEAFRQANALTPVDTGEARKGWHFSAGAPTSQDRRADGLVELASVVDQSAPESDLWFQNNVEHITVLDQGLFNPPDPGPSSDPRPDRTGRILVRGGYSVQAPRGIKGDLIDAVAAKFGLDKL